jgi:ABC-type multidrug transport system fused ATPase/permease subunit
VTPAAEVLARVSSDLAALEAALVMSVSWGLMPALDAVAGTVVLFVLDWRLALIAVPGLAVVRPGAGAPRAERDE